ncbi:SpoIIE family protein phosphatase [Streptomyces massasporeus]|uniref:SpoIIE family protein phosphatase n=1 Tax=Streptomyces massasporeus TaxID=67324 RepID=UPI0036A62312
MTREQQTTSGAPGVGSPEQVDGLPFIPRVLATARRVAGIAALAAGLLGLVSLVGWISGADALKGVLPGVSVSMKANTAVAVVALGLSLYVISLRRISPVALAVSRAAAVLVTLIGTLTLAEYAIGADLGIDELLFKDDTVYQGTGPPGRMAPNTTAALIAGGVGALCASVPRIPAWVSQILGLGVGALGMLRLYGAAYGVTGLEQFGPYSGMALHTAVALILFGTALFLARPGEGSAGLMLNAGTTGALGRWLFVTVVIVPPLLGWTVLAAEDAGLFGERLGTGLLVFAHVTVFTAVIFTTLAVGRRVEVAHGRLAWRVRQNELLQAFIEYTPAMVFIKDLEGRLLAVNTRFEQTLRLSREQVLGRLDRDVLPPDFARQARASDLAVLAEGRPIQRQKTFALPGGRREFLSTRFLLNDTSGAPYALGGVYIDITDRVAAEREVQRAHRRFVALLESAPDATLITDGDGIVVMANPQVKRLFGREPGDLVGTEVVGLVPAARRRRHCALLRAYLRLRDPKPTVLDKDLFGLRGDGSEFPVEVSVSSLQAEQETLVVLTVRDITERRRLEAERAERYEQQRRIAYTLQHSLMGEPPRLAYLPCAYRYLASVQDPGVGGDWFDVIPLDEHRTGVLIGDVMGRGLEAAAVMGQLRSASHALARTGATPSALMKALDRFVGDLAGQLVTTVYLVLDQDRHEVTLCSAGHLPVITLPPDGPAYRLKAPVGVPLGVNDAAYAVPFEEVTLPLPPGSALVLYTDGLVERPGTDIEAQVDVLTHTVGVALKGAAVDDPGALDRAADCLLRTLIVDADASDDDVTLLLLGVPGPHEHETRA